MTPDSSIPTNTLDTSAPTPPATDLVDQIEAQLAMLDQESRSLKEQAAQKDKQAADIRVRLATIAGTRSDTVKVPQIGQTVAGKGIYMGVWEPKDRGGNSLTKKFAVYAAPEDLTDESGRKLVATFQDTARRITALRNWHGHDGGDFADDAALYRGLADGSAAGKWFIPTRDLMAGTDLDGNTVQNDNLVAHKDKLGEIITSREGCDTRDYPNYYWTLAEHRDISTHVWCARLADGVGGWGNRGYGRMSYRPLRVEALSI